MQAIPVPFHTQQRTGID